MIMIGGGGTLNWSFIEKGLTDEISVIMAPNTKRFFSAKEPYSTIKATAFKLKSVEQLGESTVWMRYEVKKMPKNNNASVQFQDLCFSFNYFLSETEFI